LQPATRLTLLGALALVVGCADRTEFTTIEFKGGVPAVVNTSCGGGECAIPIEAALVMQSSESLPEDASIEAKQYRVDYELAGMEPPPFFADELDLVVVKGSSQAFTMSPAGETQRSYVIDRIKGDSVSGQATVTVAGWDDLNNTVEVTAVFDITFAAIETEEEPTDEE
jgi:hypothetical protein